MKFFSHWVLYVASLFVICACDPVLAGLHLHGSGGLTTSFSGIVGFAMEDFPFVNLVKMAPLNFTTAPAPFILPNFLTADQYPTGTLTGSWSNVINLPNNYFDKYVLSITGTVTTGLGLEFQGFTGNVYSTTGSPTIAACGAPPCYITNNLGSTGTNYTITFDLSTLVTGAINNGSGLVRLSTQTTTGGGTYGNGKAITITGVVGSDGNGCGANGTFTISNYTTTTIDLVGSTFTGGCTYTSGGQIWPWQAATDIPNFNMLFNSGSTFTNITSIEICKLADYNADNTCNTTAGKTAWPGGFNDDLVQSLAALKPRYIRYLDVNNQVFNAPADWANQPKTTWMTYLASSFIKARWLGSASGTNSYSATCSAPCTYSLTGGAPADGDFVQAYITNASTTRLPTLTLTDINSTTSSAIPIVSDFGWITDNRVGGTSTNGDIVTLTFASSCISGGTTTATYTVQTGNSPNQIVAGLQTSIAANAALTALPIKIDFENPNGDGSFYIAWGTHACAMTITPSVSGAATETVGIGNLEIGGVQVTSINTLVYNALLGEWLIFPTGVAPAWPYSLMIQLTNAVASAGHSATGCWLQTSILYSTASFTSLANFSAANPCTGGTWFEVSNEIWNPGNLNTKQAGNLDAVLGLGQFNFVMYEMLRSSQLFQIAETSFAGQLSQLHTVAAFQAGAATANLLNGVGLCGTSCSNTSYQNAIGVNYDTGPTQPHNFLTAISEAPYTAGAILNNLYQSSGSYASWSATSSSVTGNVLTVSGTVTGTISMNQGISACSGVYIVTSSPNWATGQLTGTVTTTLNGATAANVATWTLTSVVGLQTGMWIYDATSGNPQSTISSINAGANQITLTTPGGITVYPSAGSNDTLVFGGKAGTYQLNSTSCSAVSGTITGGDILGLQYAADNYNGLNSALGSQQDALNWMYQDGVVSTNNGLLNLTTTIQSYNYTYGIMNNIGGYNLPVQDYEAGYQPQPPTITEATSMGLTSSAYGGAGGYVNILLNGFKNSSQMFTLETLRHTKELAHLPVGSITTWFNYEGLSRSLSGGNHGNLWGLFPVSIYYPPAWQSRSAICAYNGSFC